MRTKLTREVFSNRSVAGTGIRTFAETEYEAQEEQSCKRRCMAGREGEDGPECQCNADDRLGTEMVSQPAARNLHDGIADEECADDDAICVGARAKSFEIEGSASPMADLSI